MRYITSAKTKFLNTLTIAWLVITWGFLHQAGANAAFNWQTANLLLDVQTNTNIDGWPANAICPSSWPRHDTRRAFGLAWGWGQYLVNICDESKQRTDRKARTRNMHYKHRFYWKRSKYLVMSIDRHCQKNFNWLWYE